MTEKRLIPKSNLKPVERGRRNNDLIFPIPNRKATTVEKKLIKKIRDKKRRQYKGIPAI